MLRQLRTIYSLLLCFGGCGWTLAQAPITPITDIVAWTSQVVGRPALEGFGAAINTNLRFRPGAVWPSSLEVVPQGDATANCASGLSTERSGLIDGTYDLILPPAGSCHYAVRLGFRSAIGAFGLDYVVAGDATYDVEVVHRNRSPERFKLASSTSRSFWGFVSDVDDIVEIVIDGVASGNSGRPLLHMDNIRWVEGVGNILYTSGYGTNAPWPQTVSDSGKLIDALVQARFTGIIADRTVGDSTQKSGPFPMVDYLKSKNMLLVASVTDHLKKGSSWDAQTLIDEARLSAALPQLWGYQIYAETKNPATGVQMASFAGKIHSELNRLTYVGFRHDHNNGVQNPTINALRGKTDAWGTYVTRYDSYPTPRRLFEQFAPPSGQSESSELWAQIWVYGSYSGALLTARAVANVAAAAGATGIIWSPDSSVLKELFWPVATKSTHVRDQERSIAALNTQLRLIWHGMSRWNVEHRGTYHGSFSVDGRNGTYAMAGHGIVLGHFVGPSGPQANSPDYFLVAGYAKDRSAGAVTVTMPRRRVLFQYVLSGSLASSVGTWTKVTSYPLSVKFGEALLLKAVPVPTKKRRMLPQGQPEKILSDVQSVAAFGDRLSVVTSQGDVVAYDNSSQTQSTIGANAGQVTVAGSDIYMIDRSDHSVWFYLGVPTTCAGPSLDGQLNPTRVQKGKHCWLRLGYNAATIGASSLGLFKVDLADDNLYRFDPSSSTVWRRIGVGVGKLAVGDDHVLVVNKDTGALWDWQGRPDYWEKIGNEKVTGLTIAGSRIYILTGGGVHSVIKQYGGQPFLWTKIGEAVSSLAGNGDRLTAVNDPTGQLWNYRGEHLWDQIGSEKGKLVAMAGENLYILKSDGTLWIYR